MPNQEESRDGMPRKDADRPTPDVGRAQSESSPRGDPADPTHGEGNRGKAGLTSDEQSGLVAPSGVNERDHGAADDKPMAGGTVNLDDEDMAHPRGKTTPAGRTWDEKNPSDAGELGKSPGAGLSDRNGPSDPDNRNKAR